MMRKYRMTKKIIKKIIPYFLLEYAYYVTSKFFHVKYIKKEGESFEKISINNSWTSFYGKCEFESGVKVHGRARFADAVIGKYTYFAGNNTVTNCTIGRYCSIAPGATIGLETHPTRDHVSTHPSFFSSLGQSGIIYADKDYFSESIECVIGNDVWIGQNALVMGGVKIGDGAIIGAGAVVTKDVEPYSIVGGVPARLIRMRFEQDEIDYLLNFKWWDKGDEWLRFNWKLFLNINEFKKIV